MENVRQAQKTLETIRKEAESRLEKLRAEIVRAEAHGYEPSIEQAKRELTKYRRVFDKSIERAEKNLAAAQEAEAKRAEAKKAEDGRRAAAAEVKTKARALRAFMDAGGTSTEFEKHWPAIREAALQQAAVQGAVSESENKAAILTESL